MLAGLPAEQTGRLQRGQNSAARLVLKKHKRDHTVPLSNELHRLLVKCTLRVQDSNLCVPSFGHYLGDEAFGSLLACKGTVSLSAGFLHLVD